MFLRHSVVIDVMRASGHCCVLPGFMYAYVERLLLSGR